MKLQSEFGFRKSHKKCFKIDFNLTPCVLLHTLGPAHPENQTQKLLPLIQKKPKELPRNGLTTPSYSVQVLNHDATVL